MDYISKLTEDEARHFCELIPVQEIRKYFLRYPKAFHKIFPGREARKLSNREIKGMLLNSRSKPFISSFLNTYIKFSLDRIQKECDRRIKEGESGQYSILHALLNSEYQGCPELYYKLTDCDISSDYVELMKGAVKSLQEMIQNRKTENSSDESFENQENPEEAEKVPLRLAEAEEEIRQLKNQCQETQSSLESERQEHQQIECEQQAEIEKTRQEAHDARLELESVRKQLDDTRQELDNLQKLADRADLSEKRQGDSDYPYASLCRVDGLNLYRNGLKLRRLADIVDGVILNQWDSEYPQRDTLYENYRIDKSPGFIGVWIWKLDYNSVSGKMDYVQSAFRQCPAEIKILSGCNSAETIVERLLTGVEFSPSGNKILFARNVEANYYTGVLCRSEDLDIHDGTVMLKSDVLDLGLFDFTEQEIVRIAGLTFYFKTSVGFPQKRIPVKNPLEVIQQKVVKLATNTMLKPYGFTNRERQLFHQFLEAVSVSNFYQEIALTCGCSGALARQYVDEFVRNAENYLNAEDMDGYILSSVITHSPALLQKCKESLEEDWRKEYSEQIDAANIEFDSVKKEIQKKQKKSADLDEEYQKMLSEIERINSEITERQRFLESVEKNLSVRMENARKNAADFAAEMIGIMPFLRQNFSEITNIPRKITTSNLFCSGQMISGDLPETLPGWEYFLNFLQDNLQEAGISETNEISETLTWDFAAYLYAAALNHIPLLLSGPNGRDIANAFSITQCGRTAAVLDCSGPYAPEALEACVKSEDQIIALLNPLNSEWVGHIAELASIPGKYMFAVQPFAEDLAIEPRGLYNYFLPVLTELLISDITMSRNYASGFCGDDFADFQFCDLTKFDFKPSSFLGLSGLTETHLKRTLCSFWKIVGNENMNLACLFALFPYAYATGQADKLLSRESLSVKEKTKDFFRTYLGDDL